MPTTDDPYVYGRSGSGENRGYDPSQRNVQRVSNIAYGRTSAFTYDIATLPSQEFAETHWPPSVYQAAQYPFSIPLTLRQRCTEVTQPDPSIEESWQASHTVTPLSYHGRSRNVTLPQTIDSQELYSQNPYTMTGYTNTSSQHPPLDVNAFTEMAEDRYSPESPRPRSSGASRTNPESDNVQTLHCSECEDATFTGYCARRNYNRHMERHKNRNATSIRCSKPECAKTFGRGDALLVHLRRSHPELDVPPAKKRK